MAAGRRAPGSRSPTAAARRSASAAVVALLMLHGCTTAAADFTCDPNNDDATECAALGAFYTATQGSSWTHNSGGWVDAAAGTGTASYCSFYGIGCANGNVVSMYGPCSTVGLRGFARRRQTSLTGASLCCALAIQTQIHGAKQRGGQPAGRHRQPFGAHHDVRAPACNTSPPLSDSDLHRAALQPALRKPHYRDDSGDVLITREPSDPVRTRTQPATRARWRREPKSAALQWVRRRRAAQQAAQRRRNCGWRRALAFWWVAAVAHALGRSAWQRRAMSDNQLNGSLPSGLSSLTNLVSLCVPLLAV